MRSVPLVAQNSSNCNSHNSFDPWFPSLNVITLTSGSTADLCHDVLEIVAAPLGAVLVHLDSEAEAAGARLEPEHTEHSFEPGTGTATGDWIGT